MQIQGQQRLEHLVEERLRVFFCVSCVVWRSVGGWTRRAWGVSRLNQVDDASVIFLI